MMKPTPTTCMAMSFEMPNREQAMGMSSREPPATPEAPQAPSADMTDSRMAAGRETCRPSVLAAASVMMVMVMAAPSMLMVAPSGMETEYISLSRPSFSHRVMLTGMFAAELRVKKAVRPDSRRQRKTSGYGLQCRYRKTMNGETTNAMKSMVPTSRASSLPYWVKMDRPLFTTLVYTRPMMPKGARLMIQRTIWDTASAVLARKTLVLSAPYFFIARPNRQAQNRMPM